MLQLTVMVLSLLCLGLAWFVFRLVTEREYDYELDTAVERAIFEAGWLEEYHKAHRKAKEALVKGRALRRGKPVACNE